MLRRVGVAISVGLADSLNPSTVGPALSLPERTRDSRGDAVTIGVFSVTFAGGLVLTIGPGRVLLGLVPHPQGTVRHVIELVAGVVLLILAVALWRGRRSLARRELPGRRPCKFACLAKKCEPPTRADSIGRFQRAAQRQHHPGEHDPAVTPVALAEANGLCLGHLPVCTA